jgi:hypothetical protein
MTAARASLALLSAGAAAAAFPALAEPAGAGAAGSQPATLTSTLSSIAKDIGDHGSVAYAAHTHDSANGQDAVTQVTSEASHVAADPAACTISYHWRITANGAAVGEQDRKIALNAVTEVQAHAGAQGQSQGATGLQTVTTTTTPPIFVVTVMQGASGNAIYFTDSAAADELVADLTHAAELCDAKLKTPT